MQFATHNYKLHSAATYKLYTTHEHLAAAAALPPDDTKYFSEHAGFEHIQLIINVMQLHARISKTIAWLGSNFLPSTPTVACLVYILYKVVCWLPGLALSTTT